MGGLGFDEELVVPPLESDAGRSSEFDIKYEKA